MGLEKNDLELAVIKARKKIKVKQVLKRRIPIIGWLPTYTLGLFLQDLLAGFTVSLTEIPQGIAYAVIAGLPTQYGLYSGCMGCFIYIVIGSCRIINIGPTAIMALMSKSTVSALGSEGAVLMCFMTGCFIFLAGLMNLGFVVDFFSYPVTAAFTTAAAIEIASSQVKTLLGIKGNNDSFLGSWRTVIKHGSEFKKWDLVLGCITIVFLFIVKEIGNRYGTLSYRKDWSKRKNYIGRFIYIFCLSRNAIVVVTSSVIAYFYHKKGYSLFSLTGSVEQGLPPFKLPPFSITYNGTYYSFFDVVETYGASLASTPIIAVVEHIAIAKAFSKGRSVDATQEFISLGLSNVMSSFVQSMPITGSFTRTAVNHASGAKTTVSGIVTGIMVLLALAFLTSGFAYIPKATLAGVIIVAMFYLCEFEAFPLLWRTKKTDLIPLIITISSSLFLSLEYGIFIGIATNMIFVLYATARPKLQIEEISTAHGDGFVVTSKTGLHYAAAEHIREKILETCCGEDVAVVLNGEYVGNIDATVAKSFHSLKDELEGRNQKLIFFNFKKSVRESILGIDAKLSENFRGGLLEDVFEGSITRV
ncbi:sodium-independent sulfate anion transporter-like [Anoplophora glabripennis]|uniref:sodium-independent sulfate anion transporter-like n=1 Tax=Anoplophora glabripennis TaxID=217634 RepID=UPI0008737EED|nr:sodium-independent sulfate anion transporter-like [Anoplophora glabripennis]